MDKKKYYKELGNKLRMVRLKNRFTQKDIASKLGVTYQQYQKYENGKNKIPTDSLEIFCKTLNCNVSHLTGSTNLEDYEKVYKDDGLKYNNSTTHVYNYYYGLFSKLFNLDLSLMKNKIVIASIFVMLITWVGLEVLKSYPNLDAKYHMVFLSIQIAISLTAFSIALFAVFGYSLLTYGVTFFAYLSIYAIIWRTVQVYYGLVPMVGTKRVIMYIALLALTFLTFYILRKCKVNLNTDLEANKKLA